MFTPQQWYGIGFLQDSWRVNDRLTLELGLRYDYYSVVKEKDDLAKPFFVEENDFGAVGDGFYNADKNNFSPRLSAAYQLNDKTAVRAGFGLFYGPGQFEDRIQPIENYIARIARADGGRCRTTACSIRCPRRSCATCSRFAATRTTTRTSTTCSTARASRASCRATSTSPSATRAARARTCSCAASATCSTR